MRKKFQCRLAIVASLVAAVVMSGNVTAQQQAPGADTAQGRTNGAQAGDARPGQGAAGERREVRDREAQVDPDSQTRRTRQTAEERERQLRTQTAGGQAAGRQGKDMDRKIAHWLIVDNLGEVNMGQFAAQRAQDDSVRQFAQKMVQEHSQAIEQLHQVAQGGEARSEQERTGARATTTGQTQQLGEAGRTTQAGRTQPGQTPQAEQQPGQQLSQQPGQRPAQQPGQQPAQPQIGQTDQTDATTSARAMGFRGEQALATLGADDPLLQIKAESGRRAGELSQRELAAREGSEFDQAYMGIQVVKHMHMLATLQAVQQHASSDLQPLIEQGIQSTEQHLSQAKQIKDQLDGGQHGDQPRRTQAAPGTQDAPRTQGAQGTQGNQGAQGTQGAQGARDTQGGGQRTQ